MVSWVIASLFNIISHQVSNIIYVWSQSKYSSRRGVDNSKRMSERIIKCYIFKQFSSQARNQTLKVRWGQSLRKIGAHYGYAPEKILSSRSSQTPLNWILSIILTIYFEEKLIFRLLSAFLSE